MQLGDGENTGILHQFSAPLALGGEEQGPGLACCLPPVRLGLGDQLFQVAQDLC